MVTEPGRSARAYAGSSATPPVETMRDMIPPRLSTSWLGLMLTPLFFRYRSMARRRAGGRGGRGHRAPGNAQERFALQLRQGDGGSFGERMFPGQVDFERLLHEKQVVQPGTSVFLAKKGDIDQSLGKGRRELWRILRGDDRMNLRQLVPQNMQGLGDPCRVVADQNMQGLGDPCRVVADHEAEG